MSSPKYAVGQATADDFRRAGRIRCRTCGSHGGVPCRQPSGRIRNLMHATRVRDGMRATGGHE